MPTYTRKLIEVDLPLAEINRESSREKSIRHGHPSTLHLWWARRPLAACRAVLFASLVDDPSEHTDEFPTIEAQDAERVRLHDLIVKLIKWETTDERQPSSRRTIEEARYEIARSISRSRGDAQPDKNDPAAILRYLDRNAKPIYDPFAGGGSIPLEAQRLGLRAVASDLNPIAVLINKALIELPPKFHNCPPVNPDADPAGMFTGKNVGRGKNRKPQQIPWRGAAGLADDIRYYGRWMREKAFERIGHLYPKARLPGGGEATVIAWLWARTIPCPNPACGVRIPMMTTFRLFNKANNRHWTKPIVDRVNKRITFEVQNHDDGVPNKGTVKRNEFVCVACGSTTPLLYAREQSTDGNMCEQMTAIIAEGDRKRLFVSPTDEHIEIAIRTNANTRPVQQMPTTAYLVSGRGYGITHWHQLFSERQLTALTTLSELLVEAHAEIVQGGAASEYANVVCTYLALAIGRNANGCSKFARWEPSGNSVAGVFARQAIPMVWDYAETNPFSSSSQNWLDQVEWVAKVVARLPANVNAAETYQADASTTVHADEGPVIVTDPPYYDNISYAELSDYFYVWLRPLLRNIYPDLFAGILVPIQEEMIAAPRFENARDRFEALLSKSLRLIRERCSPEFPSSIFYAYKQQEEEKEGRTSTGWETMLTALVDADFQIVGTWPMRTELSNRANAMATNVLASSVVLVCRPRPEDAPIATRREFLDTLEHELPAALTRLTREAHIAPVDLAQAAIGPGMQVYSRYTAVETISGQPVTVRDALIEINRVVDEFHRQESGALDSVSRFCLDWHDEHGFAPGSYGEANTLAQANNVAVGSMSSLLTARQGNVQLHDIDDYDPRRPLTLDGMTAWEGCFRMAYHMDPNREDGDTVRGAGAIARAMGSDADSVERLARILYQRYDTQSDSPRAALFNNLVTSWEQIIEESLKEEPGRLL